MPNLFDIYRMTQERESLLFREARIVFDSSAISHLYTLVEDHKKTMVDILCNYKDRIWIPSHVSYEYQKNIESFRNNPLNLYKESNFNQSILFQNIDKILNNFNHPYFHPYIEEDDLTKLKEMRSEAEKKLKTYKKESKNRLISGKRKYMMLKIMILLRKLFRLLRQVKPCPLMNLWKL